MRWTQAKRTAKATREIAERLASVSRRLEQRKFPPRGRGTFSHALSVHDVCRRYRASAAEILSVACSISCTRDPAKFVPMLEQLWRAMDKGDFAYAIEAKVKRFNGHLFANSCSQPPELAP